MGLFERFPYTNFHELNATWLIQEFVQLKNTIEQFVSINALKYADPIQWNITSQYEKNTIVIDPLTGTAYISVQPVPSGVALTRTDYWTVVFDLGSFVVRAAKNFTDRFEDETTLTATFPSGVNDWLIWGDTLYKAISNIVAGDQYVIGGNIQHFTIEDVIGHLEDLTTSDKSSIVAAINEVVSIIGSLTDLATIDKSSIVAAINEAVTTIGNIIQVIGDEPLTTVADTLTGAINELDPIVKDDNKRVDLLDSMVGWWPIKSTLNLRRVGVINGIENFNVSNMEDITYNPITRKLYAIDSENTIYTLNLTTFVIESSITLSFVAGSASGLDYNPDDDEFYVSSYDSGVWKCYRVDGTTFSNLGLTGANGHLFYDRTYKTPISFIGSGNTSTIIVYDRSFVVQSTKTIPYETFGATDILTQSGGAHNGIIYSANRDTLVQIDYINELSHSLQTVGEHYGDREIEGFFSIDDTIYMSARVNVGPLQNLSDEIFVNGSIQSVNPNSLYQGYINQQRVYNYAGGSPLPSGTDLNDVTILGNYYCYQSSINSTLINKPSGLGNRAFKMRVEYANAASSQRVQVISEGTRPIEYRRYYDNSTMIFGDWIETMRDMGTLGTLQYDFRRLSGSQTVNVEMKDTIALVICSRDNYSDIFILDFWNATPHKLQAGINTDRITFTKSANSLTLSITNAVSSATDIMIIGARITT